MPNQSTQTPARQDYLKAIFHLGLPGRGVAPSDVARALHLSKPSVSSMLKRLCEEGLLEYASGRAVRLTKDGVALTMRVIRRHRLLERFFVEVLGLDWSEVHEEAEILEHHLSDRIVDAIDRVLGHPSEDPHGHPIPDADGRLTVRDLTPLGDLAPGEQGVVREVHSHEAERLQRWKQLGLVPGAELL
ncbi:MAG: metal-dependent transcriptional regulator, partial [Planctomycetota bacterium]